MGNRGSKPHDYLVNRPIPQLQNKVSEPVAEHYVWLYICLGVAGVGFAALLWYLCCHARPPTYEDEESRKGGQTKQRLLSSSHGQMGTKTSPVQPQPKFPAAHISEFAPEMSVTPLVKPGKPMNFGGYQSIPPPATTSDTFGLHQNPRDLDFDELHRKDSMIYDQYGALNPTHRGSMHVEGLRRSFNDYLYLASVSVPIEVDDDEEGDKKDKGAEGIKTFDQPTIFTIEKAAFELEEQDTTMSANRKPSAPEIPREEQLSSFFNLTKAEFIAQASQRPPNPM